jgi:hypothetical protein
MTSLTLAVLSIEPNAKSVAPEITCWTLLPAHNHTLLLQIIGLVPGSTGGPRPKAVACPTADFRMLMALSGPTPEASQISVVA